MLPRSTAERRRELEVADGALSPPCAVWLTVEGERGMWHVLAVMLGPGLDLPIRIGRTDGGSSYTSWGIARSYTERKPARSANAPDRRPTTNDERRTTNYKRDCRQCRRRGDRSRAHRLDAPKNARSTTHPPYSTHTKPSARNDDTTPRSPPPPETTS